MRLIHRGWNSIQIRLLMISVGAIVAVLGGVGSLTTWRLRQDLLVSTEQLHRQVTAQFADTVRTYEEMYPPQESVQRAVAKLSTPNLGFRISDAKGTILAETPMLDLPPELGVQFDSEPKLLQAVGHTLIGCRVKLSLSNQEVVSVHLVSDLSHSYQAYQSFVQTLLLSGSVGVILAVLIGQWLIKRSLRPLTNISQISSRISVEHLQDARVVLQDPPLEVHQLSETFNEMLNRLSHSWEQQRQLLSNISHELRTPLCIVQGYLESTLRRGQNLSDPQVEAIKISLEETTRATRLLKDLIDLARAESGVAHLRLEPLLLNDFLEEMEMVGEQLGPNPLHLEIPKDPLSILADRDRLKQVVLNLLTNAMRYSDPEGSICLQLQTMGDRAILRVQDHGIGIPAEHLPFIFDRFYRIAESRSRSEGGIGLGLAISKTLVETMQGRISVESQVGVGSIFSLSFPILKALPNEVKLLNAPAGVDP